jgi:hypothetical protein
MRWGTAWHHGSSYQACLRAMHAVLSKYWIRAYKECLLGTDAVNSADKYKTHLSQHRINILDKHSMQGPGRRWLSRNQTLSCTVSSRIKIRFTLLRSWLFRLRSRLWLHKIIALDFEMMLRYSGVPNCTLHLSCCGMVRCIGPGFPNNSKRKQR